MALSGQTEEGGLIMTDTLILHDSYCLPSLTVGREAACEYAAMAAVRVGGAGATKRACLQAGHEEA